jgi:hypothetical protein
MDAGTFGSAGAAAAQSVRTQPRASWIISWSILARMKADVADRFSSGPGDGRTSGTEVYHQKTGA